MSFNVLLILIFSVYVFSENIANKIEINSKTDHGSSAKYYLCQFPFYIDGAQYIYGQSEDGNNWFIRELFPDGTMGNETHKGQFSQFYAIQFPFLIDEKQYFYGQNKPGKDWFIRELKPGGKMGEETDHGRFNKFYDTQFSFSMDGRVYFYGQSKSGYNWFIQDLKSGGKMGKETDHGRFGKFYGMQFPFSINGKQYFYGQSENGNSWFVQELKSRGKMSGEADHGNFNHFYDVQFPFSYGGHLFFYGESKGARRWFIRKLLPNGTVDYEENSGLLSWFYRTQFVFSTGDQQFVYKQNSEAKYWSIVEVYLCKTNDTSLSEKHFSHYRLASWNIRDTSRPESIWTNLIESEVRNTDNDEDNDEYKDFSLDVVALQESGGYLSSSKLVGQDNISPSPITYIEANHRNEFNLTQRLLRFDINSRPVNLYFYHVGNSRADGRTNMAIISRQRADEVVMVGPINRANRPIIGIRLAFDYFFNINVGNDAHRNNNILDAVSVIEHYMGQQLQTNPFVTWVIVGDYNTHSRDLRQYLPTPPPNVYRIFVVPSDTNHFGSGTDRILDYAITGRGVSNDGELVPQANDRTSTDHSVLTFIALTVQPLRNCRANSIDKS